MDGKGVAAGVGVEVGSKSVGVGEGVEVKVSGKSVGVEGGDHGH